MNEDEDEPEVLASTKSEEKSWLIEIVIGSIVAFLLVTILVLCIIRRKAINKNKHRAVIKDEQVAIKEAEQDSIEKAEQKFENTRPGTREQERIDDFQTRGNLITDSEKGETITPDIKTVVG